ncbi:transcriptional regulator, ArsR family [Pyrobaculum neutrophilum V24Sta]|uniref:Transcriptional regulator, ArsR family n=1 Tax=Pyrobaculum neutrophilum (strain DSM 2338 / JCM 9278 / NBRC 100436 / V24Sta) TaxID=444157 RepID=B1YD81_PYRNV|nr:transcriptional regulator, ArsR family [Pyrobaculum neutrophilum V24Sta]
MDVNITVFLVLAPLAAWMYPVYVPPNSTAYIHADLPPALCNVTGTLQIDKPTTVACVNTALQPAPLRGSLSVEYPTPPPQPPPPAPEAPIVAVAAGAAAAAGLSHLASNRRELLAAPVVAIAARVKRAVAEDPARREILNVVEKMGAATLSQIAKATGRGWGAVQWHLYVLEREGRVRSVRIGPFTYYYVNPRAAAEVILSSVDPETLSPEDREKLDLMASSL